MYIVPWHKEIETGIELVDKQHKEFLINANKFIIKVRAQKDVEAATEEMAFLENYLLYHFQTEETFQFESNYPDYLNHQAAHKNLAFKVKQMSIQLKAHDFSPESIQLFYEMISTWIKDHILSMDKEFANYYLEHNKQQ